MHDDAFAREFEYLYDQYADETGEKIPNSLLNRLWREADFAHAHNLYAKEYAQTFIDWYLDGEGSFDGLHSPREYNFQTDAIDVQIPSKTVKRLFNETDKETLTSVASDRHTSRSGFISFYDPDWTTWGNVLEWDHNQLGTLLQAYLETILGEPWNDTDSELSLMEHITGNNCLLSWVFPDQKPLNLYDYLIDRSKRAIKTMAQWRIAYAKPWQSTPLGSYCYQ